MRVRIRHLRYQVFSRLRYHLRTKAWLNEQADRLNIDPEDVFDLIKQGHTSFEVERMAPFTSPTNSVAPTITGTPKVGTALTALKGTWSGNPTPTYAYQWKAGGVNIAGATGTTYTPVSGDVGKTITVTVTATNSQGNASATSAATAAVAA